MLEERRIRGPLQGAEGLQLMKTSVIFVDGDGHQNHICLDGVVDPKIIDGTVLVSFTSEDGERFIVSHSRLVGIHTFEEDNVVELKSLVLA